MEHEEYDFILRFKDGQCQPFLPGSEVFSGQKDARGLQVIFDGVAVVVKTEVRSGEGTAVFVRMPTL